jgi:putative flippase GtrA
MTTAQILAWVMTGGAAIIISLICERWPKFQTFTGDMKFIVQVAAACILAILAQIGITYIPAAALTFLDPYVATVIGIFGAFGINQIAHRLDPKRVENS